MGLPVKGAPLPQQTAKRWYMVRSPKGPEARRVTCLDDVWEGFWTHWDGRVFPCQNTPACEKCGNGYSQRWSGYFAAWDLGKHDRCIEAITEGQGKALRVILQQRGSLRGCSFEFRRCHPTKPNSPVAHPIIDSLNRMWGINDNFRRNSPACPPLNEEQFSGRGIPLPTRPDDVQVVPVNDRPTAEQHRRLREVLGSFGRVDG